MTQLAEIICNDENAMQALGVELNAALSRCAAAGQPAAHSLVTLSGELGAGKSVLARAIIHAAGYSGRVKSPTYTLIEDYTITAPTGSIARIAHLDLYRLADPEELHFLGFDELLDNHDLVLVEWPERAGNLLPEISLQINIEYALPVGRRVTLQGELAGALAHRE